jgi:hypothetical protein
VETMDPVRIVRIIVRLLHISSVATLVGGTLFARVAAGRLTDEIAARWRPVVFLAIAVAFTTGVYTIANSGPRGSSYHMWFGIKMLLALHVFVVSVLATRERVTPEKRQRMVTGAAIAAFTIVAISAILRG